MDQTNSKKMRTALVNAQLNEEVHQGPQCTLSTLLYLQHLLGLL